jgi:hypothetical protein
VYRQAVARKQADSLDELVVEDAAILGAGDRT